MSARADRVRLDIKEVARLALNHSDSLVTAWLPDGRRSGSEWQARNPTRADKRPGSFSVNLATCAWADFATSDSGGDLVSLYAYLNGLTQLEAAWKVADAIGYEPPAAGSSRVASSTTGSTTVGRNLSSVPVPPAPAAHPKLGRPDSLWDYHNAHGTHVARVCRWDGESGKTYRQASVIGTEWQWKAPEGRRPLYRLPELLQRANDAVLVVEGEKAADAAQSLLPGLAVTCSMQGAQSAGRTDWTPLKGRDAVVWPDNDSAGIKYAGAVIDQAVKAGASRVAILDPVRLTDSPPPHWDAADAVAAGIEPAHVLEQVAAALASVETLEQPDSSESVEAAGEDSIALRLVDQHGDKLRHVADAGRWLTWDGTRWAWDTTLSVYDKARATVRDYAAGLEPRARERASRASVVAAVERLAGSDRRIVVTADQLDADPWVLNTHDGIIDMRTGDLQPHEPAMLQTKITASGLGDQCPNWLQFLERVTADDAELQGFLQRVAGYAFTGSIREHALFFIYGPGGNGKSVFLSALQHVAGDYAVTAPMSVFEASPHEQHPTNLARLAGARLVVSSETDEGRRWDEARLKSLTGGDRVAARFMRRDFFEFSPAFKLLFAGNHRPTFRNVDEALKRRVHLIPFDVVIPPDERDPELLEQLKAEAAGILRWVIQGAMDWQRAGLAPPAAVREATGEYFEEQDLLSAWLSECCHVGQDLRARPRDLYSSWVGWCEAAGEPPGTEKGLAERLEKAGFPRVKIHGTRLRAGIDVRAETRRNR